MDPKRLKSLYFPSSGPWNDSKSRLFIDFSYLLTFSGPLISSLSPFSTDILVMASRLTWVFCYCPFVIAHFLSDTECNTTRREITSDVRDRNKISFKNGYNLPFENRYILVKSPSGNISFRKSPYQPEMDLQDCVSPRISLLFLGNQPHFGASNRLLPDENDILTIIERFFWILLSIFIFPF